MGTMTDEEVEAEARFERLEGELRATQARFESQLHGILVHGVATKIEALQERLAKIEDDFDATLAGKVGLLENRATSLEHFLYGDREAIDRHIKAVEGYVTPRGERPSPGFVAVVQASLGGLQGSLERLLSKIGVAERLEKFLGPLDISNAPLDGVQVATRSFVDTAVERIAGAIRRELANEVRVVRAEFVGPTLERQADHDLLREIRDALPGGLRDRRMSVGDALRWLWDRELVAVGTCPKCGAVGEESCMKNGKPRRPHSTRPWGK